MSLGCAITNAIGFAVGMNLAGLADVLLGSAATLVAALCTYALRGIRWRGIPYLAWLPPVLVNAVVVGAEITYVVTGSLAMGPLLLNMAYVGLGQALSCGCSGFRFYICWKKPAWPTGSLGGYKNRTQHKNQVAGDVAGLDAPPFF